jgi:multiple sugar transport system ATP-binding protein
MDPAVAAQTARLNGAGVTVGLRPQGLELASSGVPAEVVVVEELGSETFVFLRLEHAGETIQIRVRVSADTAIGRGDHVFLHAIGPVHVFGPDGKRLRTSGESASEPN